MTIALSTFVSSLSTYIEAATNALVERQLSRIAGGVNKRRIF